MPRLILVAVCCALVACNHPLDDHECDALLDHYTERLLHEERPRLSFVEVKKKQQEARKLARDVPRFEFERCAELVSRDKFDCAMHAVNVDGIERCLM